MCKFEIVYRDNRGDTHTTTTTSEVIIDEREVTSQFTANTGFRVIVCNRIF
jgi:hypothetical protein